MLFAQCLLCFNQFSSCNAPRVLIHIAREGSAAFARRHREKQTKSKLWSELPSELLEQVLASLSVPDLCRLRSVCKRWNSLICTPEFGTLCVQNASRGARNGGACLVVISNLLGGSIKVLPNPPAVGMVLPFLSLKLVVDDMSHGCKIFLICKGCS